MLVALTRPVPPSISRCELTHLERTAIDYARAVEQHDAYERTLETLGCRIERVGPAPELPDSVFIEDTAVALDTVAIVARPGAASRRAETAPVADALKRYRDLVFIHEPGTLDGGDVLRVGSRIYVGLSSRTNEAGVRQFSAAAARDGLTVIAVPITRCLHLKSAVTTLRHDPPMVLLNPGCIDAETFVHCQTIDVDPAEPDAANVLLVRDLVVCAAEFPRTQEALERCGIATVAVAAGELAKAEGALTCGCILLEDASPR